MPYKDKTTGRQKVYTAIRVYDIEKVRGQQRDGQVASVQHPVAPPQFIPQQSKDDDMPF